LKEPQKENIINENNPTKGTRIELDQEKAIHQKLVVEIQ
jgi:hypothetical protein